MRILGVQMLVLWGGIFSHPDAIISMVYLPTRLGSLGWKMVEM